MWNSYLLAQAEGERLQSSPFLWGKISWCDLPTQGKKHFLVHIYPLCSASCCSPRDFKMTMLNMVPKVALSLTTSFSQLQKKKSSRHTSCPAAHLNLCQTNESALQGVTKNALPLGGGSGNVHRSQCLCLTHEPVVCRSLFTRPTPPAPPGDW